jgi:hypothetical protein
MASPVELPFAKYFDAGNRITELVNRSEDEAMAEWNSGREAFLAQCMSSAGFEYTPIGYVPPRIITELNEPYFLGETLGVPLLPASADEVKGVGYGVMTAEQFRGETEPSLTPAGQAENLAYFESLSPKARRAYQIALAGMTDDEPKVVENPNSCYDQADRLHPRPDSVSLDFLDPLFPMLGFFGTAIELDGGKAKVTSASSVLSEPELKQLQEEYADCAASKGFPLPTDSAFLGPYDLFLLAVHTAPDGSTLDRNVRTDSAPDEQQSLLASEPEKQIALADFECRTETDYVNRYTQILYDLEAAYVAEHKAELDKMMATIESLEQQLSDD